MLKELLARRRQGFRTIPYPQASPPISDRFRGRPDIDLSKCPDSCRDCADACPTEAIRITRGDGLRMDLGRCLFCTDCIAACPEQAIAFTPDFKMAARQRGDLVTEDGTIKAAAALDNECRRLFRRSLKLRQVSAGGCNACEQDVNVLNTVIFDLGRFGIQFVASPRHADGLLITGPVTKNMELALKKTYDAIPAPKIVIAVGACAISGGPFIDSREVKNGADSVVPVDLYIPGCPPHPLAILDGLLRLLEKTRTTRQDNAGAPG